MHLSSPGSMLHSLVYFTDIGQKNDEQLDFLSKK